MQAKSLRYRRLLRSSASVRVHPRPISDKAYLCPIPNCQVVRPEGTPENASMAHRTDASEHRRLPKWPPLLSLILPGLGQMVQGQRSRGVGLLATVLALGGLILWQKVPLLLVPLGAVWLWGVWDAVQSARNRPSGTVAPFLLGAFIVYALAVRATEINPGRLVSGWPTVRPIVRALVHPELLEYPKESHIGYLPFQVPCVEPLPPPQGRPAPSPA